MIWTGLLLCLWVTWTQGKPSEDADASSVVSVKSLSQALNGIHGNKRKIAQIGQNFFFRIAGKTYVQAFSEQGLNWEEAKAGCQKLGDILTWLGMGDGAGVTGDLASFTMKRSGVSYSEWTPEWNDYKRNEALIFTIQDIKKITGAFKDSWAAKQIGTGHCSYLDSSHRIPRACDEYKCKCEDKLNAFFCQFS